MSEDKIFLTYNQQMRKLRNKKNIDCNGSNHKTLLVRSGYFNLINGYKNPFVCGTDAFGDHIYLSGTSIEQIHTLKRFDDDLRSFLLKYITQIEEEVRSLTAYRFDLCNDKGKIPWYDTNAYDPSRSLQDKMGTISDAYSELSRSRLDYVRFYMDNHKQIPTWIMLKVVNFSTFIYVLQYSKKDVVHSVCKLYNMYDQSSLPNAKLLIGSLHWMRTVRNSCAHNERIYCISRKSTAKKSTSRILEKYFLQLKPGYRRSTEQCLFDLFVYFKYYLPDREYRSFINTLYDMLSALEKKISTNAFDYVRGKMGIKDLSDLITLRDLPSGTIEYNHFSDQ